MLVILVVIVPFAAFRLTRTAEPEYFTHHWAVWIAFLGAIMWSQHEDKAAPGRVSNVTAIAKATTLECQFMVRCSQILRRG